jgi:hypothetical protein
MGGMGGNMMGGMGGMGGNMMGGMGGMGGNMMGGMGGMGNMGGRNNQWGNNNGRNNNNQFGNNGRNNQGGNQQGGNQQGGNQQGGGGQAITFNNRYLRGVIGAQPTHPSVAYIATPLTRIGVAFGGGSVGYTRISTRIPQTIQGGNNQGGNNQGGNNQGGGGGGGAQPGGGGAQPGGGGAQPGGGGAQPGGGGAQPGGGGAQPGGGGAQNGQGRPAQTGQVAAALQNNGTGTLGAQTRQSTTRQTILRSYRFANPNGNQPNLSKMRRTLRYRGGAKR